MTKADVNLAMTEWYLHHQHGMMDDFAYLSWYYTKMKWGCMINHTHLFTISSQEEMYFLDLSQRAEEVYHWL